MSTSYVNGMRHDSPVMSLNDIHTAFAPRVASRVARVAKVSEALISDVEDLHVRVDALAKRDRDATKRVKTHLALMNVSMIMSVLLTFVAGPIAFHLAGLFVGMPSDAQEVIDWVMRW